jgi:poly-gamma-glutamate synthesis protein (capsule biosynthesis protein)
VTRDFRGPGSSRQASRRREPTFERQAPSARRVLGMAALVLVVVASGAFVVGAVVTGAEQPPIPDLAVGASPSTSPGGLGVGGPISSADPSASTDPSAEADQSPELLPPGEVAWVPVVGFWSTTNAISEQAIGAALSGGSVKYKAVMVPADDVAAIEEALGVTISGSVGRGTPDEVRAAVKAGALGILRASDVTPAVRALGIGKQQLFGISRTDSLDTWPLRGEVEDPAPWDQARTWTLVAGGDILLDRGVALTVRSKKAGVDFPYDGGSASIVRETCCNATYRTKTPVTQRDSRGGAFRSYLESADIALANLESPVDDQFAYHSRGTVFSGDPKLLEGVENAGFDVLSLANNHIRDAGTDGIMETVKALKARGIASTGAGKGFANARKPAVLETHGVTVAIFGCDAIARRYWSSGSAIGSRGCDRTTLVADIKKAKDSSDVVIVFPHWGIEYRANPSASQRRLAKAWAKAGADLVIGNHAHWAAAMEAVGEVPVWYALGNLVFDQTWSTKTMEGITLELTFEGERLRQIRIRPHLILDKAQPNFMDPTGDGAAVLKQVRDASKKLWPY